MLAIGGCFKSAVKIVSSQAFARSANSAGISFQNYCSVASWAAAYKGSTILAAAQSLCINLKKKKWSWFEKTTWYVLVPDVLLPIRFISQLDCFEKIKLLESIETYFFIASYFERQTRFLGTATKPKRPLSSSCSSTSDQVSVSGFHFSMLFNRLSSSSLLSDPSGTDLSLAFSAHNLRNPAHNLRNTAHNLHNTVHNLRNLDQ